MDLHQFGIVIVSTRDAGSLIEYALAFPASSGPETVKDALAEMPTGSELAFSDPTNSDCALGVKRTQGSFSIKRGCHGAYGNWKPATTQEAMSWLLPGVAHALRQAWRGTLTVPKGRCP